MKLYCVRHGEAMSGADDQARPLSEKGKDDITRVAQYLAQHDLQVNHILVSNKTRAKQTAAIFQDALNVTVLNETATLLDPEAPVAPLLEMIPSWHDDTMIVGHMPFLTHLVNALVIGDAYADPITTFPPGNVVCLEQTERGAWIISWLLRPSIIPK